MADTFSRSEENAFINGTGTDMPIGLLDDTTGADIGAATATITADDLITLYFSVDKKYRRNAVWMMNDKTALALRELKDNAGRYFGAASMIRFLASVSSSISNYMPGSRMTTSLSLW